MDKKRRPWRFHHRKIKNTIDNENFHPRAREIAYNRLAILYVYLKGIQKRKWVKNKWRLMEEIVQAYNSGILFHDLFANPKHISRSTLYVWLKLLQEDGEAALIPRFKWKPSSRAVVIPIKPFPKIKRLIIPGPPRTRGKKNFQVAIKEGWRAALAIKPGGAVPILDCPIQLDIFYSIPIPKGTRMKRKIKMARHRICHIGKPELDALNAFIIDCMVGIVFKVCSQLIVFHSQKTYEWRPQTTILVRTFPG